MRGHAKITPPVLERYELKFVIPDYMIDPISDFVSVYCSLDKYSTTTDDSFYGVNNLYFDTPYYLFLRNRLMGVEKRFNMRIRSYGDNPKLPFFLEIKQKRVNVIQKFRGRVFDEDWRKLFTDPNYSPKTDSGKTETKNRDYFMRLVQIYNAEPKVLTQYRRKAYVSNYEEYARVTFDIELRYMAEESLNLVPVDEQMVAYDIPTNFDLGCNVILELKCYTTQVPLWMIDCIRTFELQRRSFSKYMTGVSEVLNLYKYNDASRQAVNTL